MQNILVIGDIHVKKSNTPTIKLLKLRIIQTIKESKPDIVIIVGDMADNFDKMYLQAWNEIVDLMVEISQICQLYYTVGNHDMLNNQVYLTDDHFFRIFKHLPNVTIIDKPFRLNGQILMVPYIAPGRLLEAIGEHLTPETKLVFGHQEFLGAKMGAITSKHGDVWPESYPMFVSGHIHDRDLLQQNVLYVGAAHQTSFGDKDHKTIEWVSLTDDGSIVITPIDLNMPKKITIKITTAGFADLEVDPTAETRVIISGTTEELLALRKSKKYKQLLQTVKIIPRPIDIGTIVKNISKKDYLQLLKDAITEDSDEVQAELEEVLRSATQIK